MDTTAEAYGFDWGVGLVGGRKVSTDRLDPPWRAGKLWRRLVLCVGCQARSGFDLPIIERNLQSATGGWATQYTRSQVVRLRPALAVRIPQQAVGDPILDKQPDLLSNPGHEVLEGFVVPVALE